MGLGKRILGAEASRYRIECGMTFGTGAVIMTTIYSIATVEQLGWMPLTYA